jgi:acyl carrier protein
MTIESKAIDLIKKVCEKSEEAIINATAWDELGFDSLQTVELILQIEDVFDIVIDEDDAENIKNYNDLLTYLKGKIQ